MGRRFNDCSIAAVAGLVFVIGFAASECPTPDQLFPSVQQCFTAIGIDSATKFSVDTVSAFCSDDVYTSALECVENIYSNCTSNNNEMKVVLDKFINIDKYRDTFQYICQKLPVIQYNKVCIERDYDPNTVCIQQRRQSFERDLDENDNNNDLKATVPYFCRYWSQVAECTAMDYYRCGDEVQDVVTKAMNFIIPNVCNDHYIELYPRASNQLGVYSNVVMAAIATIATSAFVAIAITR